MWNGITRTRIRPQMSWRNCGLIAYEILGCDTAVAQCDSIGQWLDWLVEKARTDDAAWNRGIDDMSLLIRSTGLAIPRPATCTTGTIRCLLLSPVARRRDNDCGLSATHWRLCSIQQFVARSKTIKVSRICGEVRSLIHLYYSHYVTCIYE